LRNGIDGVVAVRKGGIYNGAVSFCYTIIDTALGYVGLVRFKAGLCRIVIRPSRKEVVEIVTRDYPAAVESADAFGDLPQRIVRYLDGEPVTFNDKLDWSGASSFRRDVWQATHTIPYGETRSYGWVAEKVGRSKAARAVGQALAANPMPLVVPCHRVIGSDGSLTGFTGGIEMKRHLLEIEGALGKVKT
jgi:methylated-DNA-[protein]-cysteine S-methyltransferase